jgi:hypothetical protein
MKITIPIPVTFTTDAPRFGTRTALTFVPTEFDVPEAEDGAAPMVANCFRRVGTQSTSYRLHEGYLYAALVRTDGRIYPPDIEYELNKLIGTQTFKDIQETRVDDLHPRNAKEIMALIAGPHAEPTRGYKDYLKAVSERVANKRMLDLASASRDFESRREQAVAIISDAITRLLIVSDILYRKTFGIAFSVNSQYNSTVRVSETEMWNGSLWRQKPDDVMRLKDHLNTHYFSYADRDDALAFAQEIGGKLGRSVLVDETEVTALAPLESFPKQDLRWAELVRSATAVAHFTGSEVARRIRNQEASIFTDDRSLRYAFDRLMEALDGADAFGDPNEHLEIAARDMLELVNRNSTAIDAKYRNLATTWAPAFQHLEVALSRWDDRPLEIEVSLRQHGMVL